MAASKCPVMILLSFIMQFFTWMLASASSQLCYVINPVDNLKLRAPESHTAHILIYGVAEGYSPHTEPKDFNLELSCPNPNVACGAWNQPTTGHAHEKTTYDDSFKVTVSSVLMNREQLLQMSNKSEFQIVQDTRNQLCSDILNSSVNARPFSEMYFVSNTTLDIHGKFIGKTSLKVDVRDNEKTGYLNIRIPLIVLQSNEKLNHIFVGVLTILIIVANILMGCKLHLHVVLGVCKKPIAPLIGLFCQFVVMPLIAYGLAYGLFLKVGLPALGLGLFTAGCSPGGGASNFWTVLFDGNVDLSITMTFISTLAAMGTLPAWMFTLGQQFMRRTDTGHIEIPYKNIMISVSVLVIPLLIGVLIRRFLSKVAEAADKALRPFLILIILFICTFGVYANLYMLKLMTWRVLLSGLCLPWIGFLFGFSLAMLSGQPTENVSAIAIETGVQNSGIAIMLLKMSFDQPEADLSSVIPVVASMFTPGPLLACLCVFCARKWLKKRNEPAQEEKDAGGAAEALVNGGASDTNGTVHMNGGVADGVSNADRQILQVGEREGGRGNYNLVEIA